MKKITVIVTVIVASFISTQSKAQMNAGDFKLGVGLHLGLPVGNFHNFNSFGVGGHVQGEYVFNENLTGAVTTGYTSFFGKTAFGVKQPAIGLIPIILGPRFYPAENFFVGAQIGLGVLTGGGSSSTAFDYYPQIGYNVEDVQIVLGYNGLTKNGSTVSHLGLTVFYTFGEGK